ncbi:MAG: hypothetical protein ABIS29_08910, partial [Vicinamibacterales bacterium]
MTFKHATLTAALLLGFAFLPASLSAEAPSAKAEAHSAVVRTSGLPVVAEHYYRMLAKVRPLLFWISRDNVGGARIGWLGDQGGSKGFELLIGSDPARAPRKINRWGYIAEELRGSTASTLGVMKQSNEESIEDAKAKLAHDTGGPHTFKAIRATTTNGQATADVLTLQAGSDLTYRDVGSLLTLLNDNPSTTNSKTVNLPQGTRPGFLLALSDLMSNPKLKSVPYVYNGRFHTLHVKGVDPASLRLSGREYTPLVRARFESENQATRERTPFEITYGTTGNLKEVPVHAMYQPKWWFQVELFLEDGKTF